MGWEERKKEKSRMAKAFGRAFTGVYDFVDT